VARLARVCEVHYDNIGGSRERYGRAHVPQLGLEQWANFIGEEARYHARDREERLSWARNAPARRRHSVNDVSDLL